MSQLVYGVRNVLAAKIGEEKAVAFSDKYRNLIDEAAEQGVSPEAFVEREKERIDAFVAESSESASSAEGVKDETTAAAQDQTAQTEQAEGKAESGKKGRAASASAE